MTSEIRANTIKNRVGLGTVSYTNTGIVVSGIVTANSFSGPYNGTDIVGTGLTLTSTDAGSAAGPELKLFRNSASPADADYLGQLKFAGESDTGVERNYAKITGKILDASNGTEDGILEFAHIKGGSQTITGRWRSDSLQLLNGTNFSVAGTSTFTGDVDIAEKIVHTGDTDTYLQFTANTINLHSGGTTGLTVLDTSVRVPTKLGINGASPQVPLDIIANGSGYAINVRGRSSDNVGEIRFTSNNYGSLYSVLQTGATYLNFQVGSTTNALRIADTGNVSIKTSNTTEGVLQVNGDITAKLRHGSSDMYGMLAGRKFDGTNALGGYAIRYASGYESPWIVGYNAGSGYNNQITFGSMTTSDRSLATGVQKRMVIDMHSGNVGIGSETPGGVLDLYHATSNTILNVKSGDAGSVINLIDNATRSSIEQNGTSLKIISDTVGSYANSDIRLQVDGGTKMLINSNGHVQLNTDGQQLTFGSSQKMKFYYEGSEERMYLQGDGAYGFAFRVNGGNRIEISKTTGDVIMQGSSGRNFQWDNSEASLYLTDNGSGASSKLKIGTGADLQLYHDVGGANHIVCANNQELKLSANNFSFYDYSGVTERARIKSTGEFHISDRNSSNTGDHFFQAGAFGIRMEDTGGFNRWNIERNYGGFQSRPLVHFSAQGRVGILSATPYQALDVGGSINAGSGNQPFQRMFSSGGHQRETKHYFRCVKGTSTGTSTVYDIITVDLNQNFHQAVCEVLYGTRLQAVSDSQTQPNKIIFGINRFVGNTPSIHKQVIYQHSNAASHCDINIIATSSTQYRVRVTFSGNCGGSSFAGGYVELIGVGSGADGAFYSLAHSHGINY